MTRFEILMKHHNNGELKQLIFSGMLTRGKLRSFVIYLFFNRDMLTSKDRAASITHASDKLIVSERRVYRAIDDMEFIVPEVGDLKDYDHELTF